MLYQSENMLRRVRVRGAVILGRLFLPWTIALNAIVLNCLTMFVLPVEAMLAEKSSRLKARKRRLADDFEKYGVKAPFVLAWD